MPATEQTWREQKLLHKVFAVSGVLLLISTIWMFAADHSREWKPIQRDANRLEIELTDWRKLQFETDEKQAEIRGLEEALSAARQEPVDPRLLEQFAQRARLEASRNERAAEPSLPQAGAPRGQLLASLRSFIADVRLREDTLLGQRKFKAADRDAAVAALGLLVRDGKPLAVQEARQAEIDQIKAELAELNRRYEDAKDYRVELEQIVSQMTREQDLAVEALDEALSDLRQMEVANEGRRSTYFTWYGALPLPGKKWLELPILDAFNSPLKIDNLWSDDLEIDYNFRTVRRFDRCTTCHKLIDKTMPGSAVVPAYPQARQVSLVLQPPSADEGGSAAAAAGSDPAEPPNRVLERVYGMRLAPEGLLAPTDVTVQYVRPASPAATAGIEVSLAEQAQRSGERIRQALLEAHQVDGDQARPGLQVGDVIEEINHDGNPIYDVNKVIFRLLDAAASGETMVLTVRRGMPNPHASHPRLDLFVGSLSPHQLSDFACTICHDGQGSATAFKWASHSPNTARQRQDWARDYGWFDNPHWIFPMYPKRLAESSCLKCHHQVTELEASPKYAEAPAPKLMHGYHLVRKYGCYGCHEVNGYDSGKSIGPDLRLEPNVYAAAQQLKIDPGVAALDETQRDWVEQLIHHPERDDIRRRLYEVLTADSQADEPEFSKDTHAHVTPLFKEVENPGELRKAGPSLRFAAHKLTPQFMYEWVREPKSFRPDTRMPEFFGLHAHLDDAGLAVAELYEPIELLGIVTYLLDRSQDFSYLEPPQDVAAGSAERGKHLFQTRGCLACHNHKDFPDTAGYRQAEEIVQGPDLSAMGDKLGTHPEGRQWLYTWIRQPTAYHVRTVMPDLFLEPIEDAEGNRTDPALDIVEYLMGSSTGWQPGADTPAGAEGVDAAVLSEFVLENLQDVFSASRSAEFEQTGIPEQYRDELKGAEVELVSDGSGPLSNRQKLVYIGRKTLGKYGCYGCHDVPGFEDAKPIGTSLADWGRKETSRLAFEHINQYLESHGHAGHGNAAHGDAARGDAGHDELHNGETKTTHDYYMEQLESGHRAGFIYQKLLEPRSYDYHKTENKKYNERLRMPHFPFDGEDRDAIITFVLGLVADPPPDKYIYHPDEQMRAFIAGRQVLEKYNCAGCHLLDAQTWEVAFEADSFGPQPEVKTYPFLHTHFTPQELAASAEIDRSGLRHATVVGMPTLDDNGTPIVYDDEGDPIEDDLRYDPTRMEFPFDLWRSAAVDGQPYQVGVLPLNVLSGQLNERRSADGGFLAKYLLPHVVAREKQVNPAAKGTEAWGWLPPPLIGEGSKVQTDWLHDFLLNPYPIRPAVVLRMPRFNMTPDEATKIVNYFAAVDGAEYPYAFNTRQQSAHLAEAEAEYQQVLGQLAGDGQPPQTTRFDDAMSVIVDNNYCVKCHLVGDFKPKGADQALAPNLALVYQRLRPQWVRDWIANPKSILPYTSMPVNLPFDPDAPHLGGVSQDLYHGTSVEQVSALVDLLMNYDVYARQRSLIAPLVKETAPADAEQPAATTASGE